MSLTNSMLVVDGNAVGGDTEDLTAYQTKADNSLQTTAKTVVGGINEINSNFANYDFAIKAQSLATGTYSQKLDSLFSAFSALSNNDKFNSFIRYGWEVIRLEDLQNAVFSGLIKYDGSKFTQYSIEMKASGSVFRRLDIESSGNTITDDSAIENSLVFYLYAKK